MKRFSQLMKRGQVKVGDAYKEDMSKFYNDPKMGIGKPKTYNVKTQSFDEDAPMNAAGAGNVAGIGVGPDGEPGVPPKKKRELDARTKKFKEFYTKLERTRKMRAERKSRLAAQATKQMEDFNHEYTLVENNIQTIKDIVKKKQNKPVKFKNGSMKVDLYTASAVAQVYDKVNSANRAKIDKMINGTKQDFMKISSAIFGMLGKKR